MFRVNSWCDEGGRPFGSSSKWSTGASEHTPLQGLKTSKKRCRSFTTLAIYNDDVVWVVYVICSLLQPLSLTLNLTLSATATLASSTVFNWSGQVRLGRAGSAWPNPAEEVYGGDAPIFSCGSSYDRYSIHHATNWFGNTMEVLYIRRTVAWPRRTKMHSSKQQYHSDQSFSVKEPRHSESIICIFISYKVLRWS